MKRFKKKHLYIAGTFAGALFIYSLFLPLPLLRRFQHRSVVSVECRYCFALTAKGCDTVFFRNIKGDSTFTGVWTTRDEACTTNVGSGFWYSPGLIFPACFGKLVTSSSIAAPDTLIHNSGKPWASLIARELAQQKRTLSDLKAAKKHFGYYMNTHSVTDEGYNQVAYRQNVVKERLRETLRLIGCLEAIGKSGRPEVVFLPAYAYCSVNRGGFLTGKYRACHRIGSKISGSRGMVILQSDSHLRPAGTTYLSYPLINLMRFTSAEHPRSCTMYALNYSLLPDTLTRAQASGYTGHVWKTPDAAVYDTDIPLLDCAEGAPVVDHRGVLIGIANQGRIVPIKH